MHRRMFVAVLFLASTFAASLPTAKPEDVGLSGERLQRIHAMIQGYIDRQESAVRKLSSMEGKQIPAWLDYKLVNGLRNEAKQKLDAIRPSTLGQASRISGVTPADVALLAVWLRRGRKGHDGSALVHADGAADVSTTAGNASLRSEPQSQRSEPADQQSA